MDPCQRWERPALLLQSPLTCQPATKVVVRGLAPAMELGALRRKLAALEYPDAAKLEAGSAELVQKLLSDLLRVTEGFRAQRHDLIAAHQQVDDFHTQVLVKPSSSCQGAAPLQCVRKLKLASEDLAGAGVCGQAGCGPSDD